MTDPVRPWAEKYAQTIGLGPESANTAAQRARLLMAHRAQGSKSSTRWRAWWLMPAVASVACLVYFAFPTNSQESTAVEPRFRGEKVMLGVALVPSAAPEVLAFGEGSRMTLAPQTSARLVRYSEQSVEVHLDEGHLDADVRKRPGSRWVVRAGSYQVVVVGTAFTVNYDEARDAVNVRVSRGAVRVLGEGLAGEGVLVQSGDSFSHQAQVLSESVEGQPAKQQDALAQAQDEPELDPSRAPGVAASPTKADSVHWQRLAESGDFARAMSEIEKVGTESVLRTSSPEDLILLGNAARFGGQPDLAEKAYNTARSRGSGGSAAALCAYYLARIALDVRGDSPQAIRWLRTYLSEAGSGSLAPSARARLMDLLMKTGDTAGARVVAQQYVTLHPKGQHIEQARRLAGATPQR